MNPVITRIDIDRLVLDGLQITPEQAERLRPLLEAELMQRLETGGLTGLHAAQAARRVAPTIRFDGAAGMERLATDLAGSVVAAIGIGVPPPAEAGHV